MTLLEMQYDSKHSTTQNLNHQSEKKHVLLYKPSGKEMCQKKLF